jgi:hypothetical protein
MQIGTFSIFSVDTVINSPQILENVDKHQQLDVGLD